MSRADNPGIPFHPPLPVLAILAAAVLLGWLVPTGWEASGRPARLALALLLFAAGAATAAWALAVMWRARTGILVHDPATTVVAHGPYRFTRNPMYLSLLAIYLGAGLLLSWVWALVLFPAAFLVLDRVVVPREEHYLGIKFGETYRAYRARVPRWIGLSRSGRRSGS